MQLKRIMLTLHFKKLAGAIFTKIKKGQCSKIIELPWYVIIVRIKVLVIFRYFII